MLNTMKEDGLTMSKSESISIVIPTKNRFDSLKRLLLSLYRQTAEINEIIIVDQSDFNCRSQLKFADTEIKIIYIYNPKITGLAQAKNLGVKASSGEYIFFFDDDLELMDDFVEDMVLKLRKYPFLFGLCGKQILQNETSRLYEVFRNIFKKGPYSYCYSRIARKNSDFSDDIEIRTKISGGITVYKKDVFSEFSFDENMIKYCLGEDHDFSYRVAKKYCVGFNKTALARHFHDSNGRLDYRQNFAAITCFYNYFYIKNCEKSDKPYLWWIKLGLILRAIFLGLAKRTVQPIKGIYDGEKMSKNKYVASPCIRLKDV